MRLRPFLCKPRRDLVGIVDGHRCYGKMLLQHPDKIGRLEIMEVMQSPVDGKNDHSCVIPVGKVHENIIERFEPLSGGKMLTALIQCRATTTILTPQLLHALVAAIEDVADDRPPRKRDYGVLAALSRLGQRVHENGQEIVALLSFTGENLVKLLRMVREPRRFRPTDRVLVDLAAYTTDGGAPTVTAELLGSQGAPLVSLPVPALDAGRARIEIPVRSLAQGTYVLRVRAALGERAAERLETFRIVP